jgi:hypothetical protein
MHCHVVNRLSRAWTASSTDSEGDLLESAAQFDRSQPVVLLAGAAVVGFTLSRDQGRSDQGWPAG